MSKQPAAPSPTGIEPRSRARAANTSPSTRGPARHRDANVRTGRHAMAPAALRDGGAGTSAAAAAASRPEQHTIHFARDGAEPMSRGRGSRGPEQPPVNGEAPPRTPGKPSYVPLGQMKQGKNRRTEAGRPPVQPPYGSSPEERRAKVERTTTITEDSVFPGAPAPGGARQHPVLAPPANYDPGKSRILPSERKKKQPMAFCFTACCILFWLLVIAVGVAVLVVYLLYRPQPPRLRVTSATLNAAYVDEIGLPGRRLALNADLTVLAAISSPNTKIDIVLRYMQIDLYFEGSMIGTQAVWPAPMREGPGGSVLRSVHLVVSEVPMKREDAIDLHNATTKGGPVVLHLAGRFHTTLIFGHWFRYNYWVTPRCTLWLDPPPSGALRRARC